MFKLFVLISLVSVALAGYGVPSGNPSTVAAPGYPVLPGYPTQFYPYPRRHRHPYHDSSSDSDSRSHNHSHENRCKSCRKLNTSCNKVKNVDKCHEPEISFVKRNGCEHAIISCDTDNEYTLIFNQDAENTILTGVANDVLAKCNKGKNWKIGEERVKHVACVVLKQ